MSLCCHDDYSRTGDINISDVNILAGFQSWVEQRGENSVTDIDEFKTYYAMLVAQGTLPTLSDNVKILPTDPRNSLDCSNFSETGAINVSDVNIFSAYQSWLHQLGDNPVTTVADFDTYYATQVARGLLPELTFDAQHLPSLENENYVITRPGKILKDCCVDCDTWMGTGTSFKYTIATTPNPAEENLSAEWYESDGIGATLCFGASDPEPPTTYYAFFQEDTKPSGAITITGTFIDDDRIVYTKGDDCYIASPSVETILETQQEINVYRFELYIENPVVLPTPTPSVTPSFTITPSPVISPTHTITPSPVISPTHTFTPTITKTEEPIVEPNCCDGLTEHLITKSTDQSSTKLSDYITAMPFAYTGTLCVGTATEGFPSSVKLYIGGTEANEYLGTLGIFGTLETQIKFSITETDNSELLNKCLEGTIENGICILNLPTE